MSRHTKNRKGPFKNLNRQLHLEMLEDRAMPSCTSISGFVYYDANNNGLYDTATETPIANSTIELRDASNVVVGSTTTDANGYYIFDVDTAHPGTDSSLTKTVNLPLTATQTNYSLSGKVDKFDAMLGQLQSIEITYGGSITSKIDVENFSTQSESDINGTVSGNLTLVAPHVNDTLTIAASTGTPFHATTYDGNSDFGGTSGGTLGEHTVDGSKTLTLTGADMAAYVGSGQVDVTTSTVATSNATGGGNLDVKVRSTGISNVKVVYHYKAFPCIAPGDYKIIQTHEPDGYTDGKESKDGVVIPNTIGTDFINVHLLDDADLVNNNFGELKVTQLSGHVWYDANNDGVLDPSEALIPGALITLQGPGGPFTATTDTNGYYAFTNLQPGTYTLLENQPSGYLDGKDNHGTLGGTVVEAGSLGAMSVSDPTVDQIREITLHAGDNSQNNDFGEIKPASIAGHVWFDANNDGVRGATELPIPNTTITLTGFDDNGPVNLSMLTNSHGEYKFSNLRPGTYAINETQPAGYADGKDSIGTPGGMQGNDVFSDIQLNAGVDGVNNDFGEIKASTPTPPTPLPKDEGIWGTLLALSKAQETGIPTWANIDPAIRAQMAFAVGANTTLTGQQLDIVGVVNAVQQLQTGTTNSQYIAQIWSSDAHRVEQANSLVESILQRPPTAPEQATVVQQLKAGTDQLTVMENLFTSPAYQQLHPTADALATALSKDILNVNPGTNEMQALMTSMGAEPLNTVVHDLLHSDASLANQIDNVYRATVRRPATTAEIQTWTPPLKAGTTTLDLLAQRLLSSQEFYQLTYNKIQ